MEELEKGMGLLERMRPIIGDEMFANRVQSLFAALPNFKNFDAAVDITEDTAVDCTPGPVYDEEVDDWTTSKRRLPSEANEDAGSTVQRKKTKDDTEQQEEEGDEAEEDEKSYSDDEENGEEQHSSNVLSSEDEDKYITYTNITDAESM